MNNFALPCSLYIHIPWCLHKCPYCDFNSHQIPVQGIDEMAYIDALLRDLEIELALAPCQELQSIFIGGGTPSLFSAQAYQALLNGIKARINLKQDLEVTLEANPGTVEQARFAAYRQLGINRLSIGVQSFHDQKLRSLQRIHTAMQARHALQMAQLAGFDNFNIDLMHGLPGQTVAEALTDLEIALSFSCPHLSWYQLTIEPNTYFYRYPPILPDEDTMAEIYQRGQQFLSKQGLRQYEVSAYARTGFQAQHNLNYWQFGDYIGIGAGAHGKRSCYDDNNQLLVQRRWKTRQPKAYLKRINDPRGFIAGQQMIKQSELALEFLLNGLRLLKGVDKKFWVKRTGLTEDYLEKITKSACQQNLLTISTTRIQPTTQGLLFLNDLLALCHAASPTDA